MTLLIAGLIIFYGMHVVPALTLKEHLIKKIGKQPYMGLFSLVSAAGLGLMIYGKSQADFIPMWQPFTGAHWVPIVLMWPALILIVWAQLPCSMKTTLRHPMLMGILLFSTAHLFANGDLATILLLGSFGLYSLVTLIRLRKKNETTANTQKTLWMNLLGVVIGTLVYILVFIFHQHITGMVIPV
jgi:uncharacterized membrane protein